MEEKLKEIALPADFHWVETLSVSPPQLLDLQQKDAQDDLKREAELYAVPCNSVWVVLTFAMSA